MIKKNIGFTDYNGNQRSEDFYFNLTKAEIAELELSTVGGLTQMLRGMIAAQDMPAIVKFVNGILPEDVRRQAEAEMKKQQEQEKLGEAN